MNLKYVILPGRCLDDYYMFRWMTEIAKLKTPKSDEIIDKIKSSVLISLCLDVNLKYDKCVAFKLLSYIKYINSHNLFVKHKVPGHILPHTYLYDTVIEYYGNPYLELNSSFTLENYRRLGISYQLTQNILQQVYGKPVFSRINIDNTASIKCAKKAGFKAVGVPIDNVQLFWQYIQGKDYESDCLSL